MPLGQTAQVVSNVAPVRERGLKCPMPMYGIPGMMGRSREGAWIEMLRQAFMLQRYYGRSREGAWIEMDFPNMLGKMIIVAPVRERGLKSSVATALTKSVASRSREGAWIEISPS